MLPDATHPVVPSPPQSPPHDAWFPNNARCWEANPPDSQNSIVCMETIFTCQNEATTFHHWRSEWFKSRICTNLQINPLWKIYHKTPQHLTNLAPVFQQLWPKPVSTSRGLKLRQLEIHCYKPPTFRWLVISYTLVETFSFLMLYGQPPTFTTTNSIQPLEKANGNPLICLLWKPWLLACHTGCWKDPTSARFGLSVPSNLVVKAFSSDNDDTFWKTLM